MARYHIKLADSDAEREQIHRLNYETFVEEIPQHEPNTGRRLIDRFDPENQYVIAITTDGSVIGMLALRASRPFSLDRKLTDLENYLPPHRSLCEVRLLAVQPKYRHQRIVRELVAFAARRCIQDGHDLAVISGTTRQLALYRHIGFEPFGPIVGAEGAWYQPMYLTIEKFLACVGGSLDIRGQEIRPAAIASFLPGPVSTSRTVRAALGGAVRSHRHPEFAVSVRRVRDSLCRLTGAADAVLLLGSGTLANDIVGSCIAARGGRGLVLANGEFGERLADHASRAALEFEVMRQPWGVPFEEGQALNALRRIHATWVWAAHCETSTGVLNDLGMLKRIAGAVGAELYLDCVSSVGTVDVELSGVCVASCASGKGLGSYPGLAVVLSDSSQPRQPTPVPRYLDLQIWRDCDSVPFTHSSSLVAALDAALSQTDWAARLRLVIKDSRWLWGALRARGLQVIAPENVASPGVTTIELPATIRSSDVAAVLEYAGFEIAWRSGYLTQRNWIQIALMGDYDRGALRELPDAIVHAMNSSALVSSSGGIL